jgi:hypothetical protein
MVIINALFAWLVEAGYLAGNPLSLSRQRARRSKPRITRYLDRELWQEVKLYIDSLPKDTPRERERYLRARWLFTLFYLGGLRISEVSGNTMSGFFCRPPTVMSAGGSKCWARATRKDWCPPRRKRWWSLAVTGASAACPPCPPGTRTPRLCCRWANP